MVAHPEGGHRGRELGLAVGTEPVVPVRREVFELRDEDEALLAARAGEEGDLRALGGVLRHRRAVAEGLVVGWACTRSIRRPG